MCIRDRHTVAHEQRAQVIPKQVTQIARLHVKIHRWDILGHSAEASLKFLLAEGRALALTDGVVCSGDDAAAGTRNPFS